MSEQVEGERNEEDTQAEFVARRERILKRSQDLSSSGINRGVDETGCRFCGGSPHLGFSFRSQVAFVIRANTSGYDAQMCGRCAQAIGREAQASTILGGWWGILSFFRNIGYVWTNSLGLRKGAVLARAPRTIGHSPGLEPGRPILMRAKTWLGIGAIGAIALAAAWYWKPDQGWEVGSCVKVSNELVNGNTAYEVTDCGNPHIGKIVSIEDNENLCAANTEKFVDLNNSVGCIDLDQ